MELDAGPTPRKASSFTKIIITQTRGLGPESAGGLDCGLETESGVLCDKTSVSLRLSSCCLGYPVNRVHRQPKGSTV